MHIQPIPITYIPKNNISILLFNAIMTTIAEEPPWTTTFNGSTYQYQIIYKSHKARTPDFLNLPLFLVDSCYKF